MFQSKILHPFQMRLRQIGYFVKGTDISLNMKNLVILSAIIVISFTRIFEFLMKQMYDTLT